MKDAVKVLLVDPIARSRNALQRQIEVLKDFELVEVRNTYHTAAERVGAVMPDMVIVVVDADIEEAMRLVERISTGYPDVALVPAGSEHDSTMILRAMRAGAREFLPLPVSDMELLETIDRVCPRRSESGAGLAARGPQVIAITGAAGGVGCTSLAVNLATTISKLSRRDTVLADFDLMLGSLEAFLGVIPDNSLDVLVRNIEEVDPILLKRWLPRHACGLYILPHPVNMEEAARLDPDVLRRVLALLKETFPTVVIDTSKGLQASDFLAFDVADVILVVIQLNLNCTRNTVRLLQYLRQYDGLGEKVKLVVNRLNSPLSEIGLKKAEELLKMPVSWQVPNATTLFRPARIQGVPIDEVEGGPGSKAHNALLTIAQELVPFPVEQTKTRRKLFSAFR